MNFNNTLDMMSALKVNSAEFKSVLAFINTYYEYTPTAFDNGHVHNDAGQNEGSCRVFAFAKLNNINVQDTLMLFAEHYQEVLRTPEAQDHQNIRQFMLHGWAGIKFAGNALSLK